MRESASAGVIWKCWSNISFRLDSAILLSASRRLPLSTPNHPSSRGGWSCWWWRSRATGNGDAGSGAEAADRGSANTLPSSLARLFALSLSLSLIHTHTHILSTSFSLTLLLSSAGILRHPYVPSVQPTLSTNLPHPFATTILLLASSVTVRSAPTDDSNGMTDCRAKRN